jgi:hypothetical protein
MNRINLTLSTEVMEQIDALASLLKVSRADIISYYLEGSTYLRKTRIRKCKKILLHRFNQP